jgi:hypothetical protein
MKIQASPISAYAVLWTSAMCLRPIVRPEGCLH